MIHSDDFEAMEKLFGSSELPQELLSEYEVQQRMSRAFGHSGSLGMTILIPMMRSLGYGKIVTKTPEIVDWRRHIGEGVIAQYGDELAPGKLVGLGEQGRLVLDLDSYGTVELPRFCVKLAPINELAMEQNPWIKVKRGTKVVVQTDAGPKEGKFTSVAGTCVRVKIGQEDILCSPESVELAV